MHMAEIFYKKLLYLVKIQFVDLVNKGIDINHQDKKEMTPLDFAKQIKDMEMINILTDKKSKF